MFFKCPAQESHLKFPVTNQMDKALWGDATNEWHETITVSLGLRYGRPMMMILLHICNEDCRELLDIVKDIMTSVLCRQVLQQAILHHRQYKFI
jgi:hypothetical protein